MKAFPKKRSRSFLTPVKSKAGGSKNSAGYCGRWIKIRLGKIVVYGAVNALAHSLKIAKYTFRQYSVYYQFFI